MPSLRRAFATLMHYAENECVMPIRLHCHELRALCLTTNAVTPYCRNRCTIAEMRADCLYLAGKRCTWFQTKTLAVIGLFQKSILYFIERVPRNPYLLTITVGLVTSRGLCGAFFLGTSLFLRIECVCGPLSSLPTGIGFPC